MHTYMKGPFIVDNITHLLSVSITNKIINMKMLRQQHDLIVQHKHMEEKKSKNAPTKIK